MKSENELKYQSKKILFDVKFFAGFCLGFLENSKIFPHFLSIIAASSIFHSNLTFAYKTIEKNFKPIKNRLLIDTIDENVS